MGHRGLFTIPQAESFLEREPDLEVTQLAPGLWTLWDGEVRTFFAEAHQSVIAFDTLGTPGAARAYRRAAAEAVPGKEIGTIVYSHDHLDHSGFGADLAPQAEVIASRETAQIIRLRGADGQRPPTRTVSGRRTPLDLDGLHLELINPGPTHGSGNQAVYFPQHKILCMADTIVCNARYGLLPDTHIAHFTRLLGEMEQLDFEIFVPGRFEVMDRAGFQRGLRYLRALQQAAQQAFVDSVPVWVLSAIDGYVKEKLQREYGDLDGFHQQVGLTAFRIAHHYLMGGWGVEDT